MKHSLLLLIPESGSATVTSLLPSAVRRRLMRATSQIFAYSVTTTRRSHDGGDEQVGGTGVFTLDDKTGTIVFTTDFLLLPRTTLVTETGMRRKMALL